jgi:UDP-2,4-diacetamido-2,4,6-trideoxy-beta-L-altropyranose hydrolase
LVRSHALADELTRRGVETWFATNARSGFGLESLHEHGHRVVHTGEPSAGEVLAFRSAIPGPRSARRPFAAVVLDHYELGAAWLAQARHLASLLVVIDDVGDRELPCDVVVNGNLGARSDLYRQTTPQDALLLVGSRYCLLRSRIAAARADAVRTTDADVRTVLVTLGGTNQTDTARVVVNALKSVLPKASVDLVVRSSSESPGWTSEPMVRLHENVAVDRMAELMGGADLAIGAGGMSAWERCALGLPSIAVRLSPNQDVVVDALAAAGAALDAGPVGHLSVEKLADSIHMLASSPTVRNEMSRRGRELVDGRGAIRVAHHIEGVRIRRARPGDARRLWIWRNDPTTRAVSINSAPIAFEDHIKWLRKTMNDSGRSLFIGWNGAGDLGQVRFDQHEDETEVHIAVAPEHRGTVGGLLLRAAIRHFRRTRARGPIVAQVKEDNEASRRLFESVGFDLTGTAGGLLQFRLSGDIDGPAKG